MIFFHYSSDYVFDGEKEKGYKEDDEPSPISNYGKSKLAGEEAVKKAGGTYYIVRLQKLFGKFDRPSFAKATEGKAKKSFFELMEFVSQTKNEIEVVDEELANFTYAPDLAERAKYIIENNLHGGVYHATNEGDPVTWFGAAKIFFDIRRDCHSRAGGNPDLFNSESGSRVKPGMTQPVLIPVPASKFPRPARRPKYLILINTKLPPMRSWVEALRESLK